jgi:hypothetical protein
LLRVQKLAPSFKDLGNLIFNSFIKNIFEEKKKLIFSKIFSIVLFFFVLGLHRHEDKHDFLLFIYF